MLTADRDELTRFIKIIFARATADGELELRSFYDASTERRIFQRKRVSVADLDAIVPIAADMIDRAARDPNAVVFCPPVTTFRAGGRTAKEQDVYEGLAISIELDRDPEAALSVIEDVLGKASVVVASGGTWHNTTFDEDEPKLHAYWVLDKPARTPEEHARLKYARRLATGLAGADATNVPLVHPIRWPGSWHRKNVEAPKLARIVSTQATSIQLEAAAQKLEQRASATGLSTKSALPGDRVDDRETRDLVRNVATGQEFHPSLTPLAMRFAVQNLPKPLTEAVLQGLMLSAGGPGDARWEARYAEVPGIVASAYAKIDFNNSPQWKLRLDRAVTTGSILSDWRNIFRAFREAPAFAEGALRYNTRDRRVDVHGRLPWDSSERVGPRPWLDVDITYACIWLNAEGFPKVKANDVNKAAEAAARLNPYDPLIRYLEAIQWDGVPRIDTWLTDYCGAALTPYTTEVGARWLLQAVARALRPGTKADCVLIFEGAQGIRKSTVFARLGGPFFAELTADISHGNKDMLMMLAGPWIVEIAELDALRKADVSRIKAFFSQTSDRYRAPYDKVIEDHPRGIVFAGTLNPDGNDYLQDVTGNRRFWPVAVGRTGAMLDTDGIARDRDQLWAEAVARYRRGERTWIQGVEIEAAARIAQDQRTAEDPWFEHIEAWLQRHAPDEMSLSDVMQLALNIPAREQDRAKQLRVARALRRAGLKKVHTKAGKRWVSLFSDKFEGHDTE